MDHVKGIFVTVGHLDEQRDSQDSQYLIHPIDE